LIATSALSVRGVTDEREQLGDDGDEDAAAVADVEVGGDVAADLRVGATECDKVGEGEQLAGLDVDAAAGVVVAEAVRRKQLMEVPLVLRCGRVHAINGLGADDLPFHRQPFLEPRVRSRGRLPFKG
jgi:hypothetical protein